MALAVVFSRALDGLSAPPVSVEVHLANGLPSFTLVGLPETEVKEARDRVRAAIVNSGFEFPSRRITVNLAPADLPKESGRFDLPIAVGILAAGGQIPDKTLKHYEFAGELSLSGELRPVRGALAMALPTADSGRAFVLPLESAREAALTGRPDILPAGSLLQVCAHICGQETLAPAETPDLLATADHPDLAEIKGQTQAKRALEIAAAGGHSLLMFGPPGAGKSMLAARLPGLVPALGLEAAKSSAAVLSLVGQFRPDRFGQRVLRSPHHTASAVALVGSSQAPPQTLPSIMAMTGAGKDSMSRITMRRGSCQPRGSRPPSGSSSTLWPEDHTLAPGWARRMAARMPAFSKSRRAFETSSTRDSARALRLIW
jgi:magnesium chelatase family protein